MLNINPFTFNTDTGRDNSAHRALPSVDTRAKSNHNELVNDSVNISNIALERLNKDNESETTKKTNQTFNEAVRVFSAHGSNKSTDNLNHEQAV